MAHEVRANDRVAYRAATEPPWHRTNHVELEPGESVRGAFRRAGLDHTIETARVYFRLPNGTLKEIPDYRAMVRNTDQEALSVLSKDYIPTQPNEILQLFEELGQATETEIETAGTLKGGKVMWALLRTQDGFQLTNGDENRGYLFASTAHDGTQALRVKYTTIRVVCWNTFSWAHQRDAEAGFTMTHRQAFDGNMRRQAQRVLGLLPEVNERQHEQAQELQDARVTDNLVRQYVLRVTTPNLLEDICREAQIRQGNNQTLLEDIIEADTRLDFANVQLSRIGAKVLESILDGPGAEPTNAWGLFQGVTHYTDHVAGRTPDTRLHSAWLGQRAALKDRAFTVARAVAGAVGA